MTNTLRCCQGTNLRQWAVACEIHVVGTRAAKSSRSRLHASFCRFVESKREVDDLSASTTRRRSCKHLSPIRDNLTFEANKVQGERE